jgi:heptosyltransferase-2
VSVAPPKRLVVLAPNWLGDVMMALPLLADIKRAFAQTMLVVAARPAVAPVYAMVPIVDDVIVLEGRGGLQTVASARATAQRLAGGSFDAALLLPNSFVSAWTAVRAGIPERWGIARDLRTRLLTTAIPRPRAYGHQVEYYQAIGRGLGIATGAPYARVSVPETASRAASALFAQHGIGAGRRFVVFAPGAAYGLAKQWLPERFAELARTLAAAGTATVLVGSGADRRTCRQIAAMASAIDLSGQTDVPTLAAVLSQAAHVVSNDSGAMHLAAAVGAPVTAIFGPTDDRRTAPLRAGADSPAATIVSEPVWCRPCMLRECPIDHRCMARITAARVHATIPL